MLLFYQWKAAKEELDENAEDEPENAYKILEKKRQQGIKVPKMNLYSLLVYTFSLVLVPYFSLVAGMACPATCQWRC